MTSERFESIEQEVCPDCFGPLDDNGYCADCHIIPGLDPDYQNREDKMKITLYLVRFTKGDTPLVVDNIYLPLDMAIQRFKAAVEKWPSHAGELSVLEIEVPASEHGISLIISTFYNGGVNAFGESYPLALWDTEEIKWFAGRQETDNWLQISIKNAHDVTSTETSVHRASVVAEMYPWAKEMITHPEFVELTTVLGLHSTSIMFHSDDEQPVWRHIEVEADYYDSLQEVPV